MDHSPESTSAWALGGEFGQAETVSDVALAASDLGSECLDPVADAGEAHELVGFLARVEVGSVDVLDGLDLDAGRFIKVSPHDRGERCEFGGDRRSPPTFASDEQIPAVGVGVWDDECWFDDAVLFDGLEEVLVDDRCAVVGVGVDEGDVDLDERLGRNRDGLGVGRGFGDGLCCSFGLVLCCSVLAGGRSIAASGWWSSLRLTMRARSRQYHSGWLAIEGAGKSSWGCCQVGQIVPRWRLTMTPLPAVSEMTSGLPAVAERWACPATRASGPRLMVRRVSWSR